MSTNDEKEVTQRDLAAAGMDASSVGLVGDILTASARQLSATQDRLWEGERRRRMVLEVRVDLFLDAVDKVFGGTTRDYENAINLLRYPSGNEDALLAMHPENDSN